MNTPRDAFRDFINNLSVAEFDDLIDDIFEFSDMFDDPEQYPDAFKQLRQLVKEVRNAV